MKLNKSNIRLIIIISIILLIPNYKSFGQETKFNKLDSFLIDTFKYKNIHFKDRLIIRVSSQKDHIFYKNDTIYSEELDKHNKPIKKFYRNYHMILEEPYAFDGIYLINYNNKGLKDIVKNYNLYNYYSGPKKHLRITKYYYNEIDSIIKWEDWEYVEIGEDTMKLEDRHICLYSFQNNYLNRQIKLYNSDGTISCYGFSNSDIKNNFFYCNYYVASPVNGFNLNITMIKSNDSLQTKTDTTCSVGKTFMSNKNIRFINNRINSAYGNSFNDNEKIYEFIQNYLYSSNILNRINEKIIYKEETIENSYYFYFNR